MQSCGSHGWKRHGARAPNMEDPCPQCNSAFCDALRPRIVMSIRHAYPSDFRHFIFCLWKQSTFYLHWKCHFFVASHWHDRCDTEGAPGDRGAKGGRLSLGTDSRIPGRTFLVLLPHRTQRWTKTTEIFRARHSRAPMRYRSERSSGAWSLR